MNAPDIPKSVSMTLSLAIELANAKTPKTSTGSRRARITVRANAITRLITFDPIFQDPDLKVLLASVIESALFLVMISKSNF